MIGAGLARITANAFESAKVSGIRLTIFQKNPEVQVINSRSSESVRDLQVFELLGSVVG
jgi:hypothetical protein